MPEHVSSILLTGSLQCIEMLPNNDGGERDDIFSLPLARFMAGTPITKDRLTRKKAYKLNINFM